MDVGARETIFVTAANDPFCEAARTLIESIRVHYPEQKIILYDLGLSKENIISLQDQAKVKPFNFSKYPAFFDISKNAGEYAWKPTLFWQEVRLHPNAYVFWLDAGDLVVNELKLTLKLLARYGIYVTDSSGTMDQWTHPKMLEGFGISHQRAKTLKNIAAGFIGVDTQHAGAVDVIRQWARCALSKETIAPPGSDRSNHRQDQALLGCIIYRDGILSRPLGKKRFGVIKEVTFHNNKPKKLNKK